MLIREAKSYLDAADEKQRDADADKWAAAERLWKASREGGISNSEIGRMVGRSHQTIARYIKVWESCPARDRRSSAGRTMPDVSSER